MAFMVVQAGTGLKLVGDDGTATTLTLPTNVTLRNDVFPRWTIFDRYVVLVNTPSQPLTIDQTGTVRLLCPKPPRFAPVISGVSGGSLSGTYSGVRCTFVVKDSVGRIIAETDFSPASNSVTISSNYLKAASIDTSPDTITLRRLYRPTTGQSVLFPWVDLDGNVLTTAQDDLSDADLGTLAAPTLGTVPDLTLIAEFRKRLFGVARDNVDVLRFSEVDAMYAWPSDNAEQIPLGQSSDQRGATALISRRDALGIGKQNRLLQFTGTDDSDFRLQTLSENVGVVSNETVDVYRDTAYFLWFDGVYAWNSEGINCISDGKVRSWFTTDDYFNRNRFQYAFGKIDSIRNKYRLFLANAGDTEENRWVEYDLKDRTWWGPHTTTALTPTSIFTRETSSGTRYNAFGSKTGPVFKEQSTPTDGDDQGIAFRVQSKRHDMQEPVAEKYFGDLTLTQRAFSAGTLTTTPSLGDLNADADTIPMDGDLTVSTDRVGKVGIGKFLQLEFANSQPGQDVELYGYEIDPVNIVGTRK